MCVCGAEYSNFVDVVVIDVVIGVRGGKEQEVVEERGRRWLAPPAQEKRECGKWINFGKYDKIAQ